MWLISSLLRLALKLETLSDNKYAPKGTDCLTHRADNNEALVKLHLKLLISSSMYLSIRFIEDDQIEIPRTLSEHIPKYNETSSIDN